MAICPLLMTAVKQQGSLMGESGREAAECIKEACAWYVIQMQPNSEGCAIAKLTDAVKVISLK